MTQKNPTIYSRWLNMYILKNNYVGSENKIQDIVVEWEQGTVKGFKSKEDAWRYIDHVCKKTAPDMEYSVSCVFPHKREKSSQLSKFWNQDWTHRNMIQMEWKHYAWKWKYSSCDYFHPALRSCIYNHPVIQQMRWIIWICSGAVLQDVHLNIQGLNEKASSAQCMKLLSKMWKCASRLNKFGEIFPEPNIYQDISRYKDNRGEFHELFKSW